MMGLLPSWQERTGWWKSTPVCAAMRPCRRHSGARAALSSRWFKRPWMPARLRMWGRWSRQCRPSIASRVRAISTTTQQTGRSWMWIGVGCPVAPKRPLPGIGYFAKQRNRRGRQLGRVLATRYDEVVVDQLFSGTTQLSTALHPLVTAAAQTLDLDAAKRARTIVRVDAGGGSLGDVNWLLAQGYGVHGKEYSSRRAQTLAASVTEWIEDPQVPGRQIGWVMTAPTEYVRPVRRIAVRCRKKNGQWGVGVVVSAVPPAAVLDLSGQSADLVHDDHAVLRAYVYFYDQRGGGVETALKGDKQGLGLRARNKKRFAAQQMVMLLG